MKSHARKYRNTGPHGARADMIDITGQRFGLWTAIRPGPPAVCPGGAHAPLRWWCRCACGAMGLVYSRHLRLGLSMKCRGCLHVEQRTSAAAQHPDAVYGVCTWCGREAERKKKHFECGACERTACRNGRDSEGRPIAKGKRFVVSP